MYPGLAFAAAACLKGKARPTASLPEGVCLLHSSPASWPLPPPGPRPCRATLRLAQRRHPACVPRGAQL